MVFPVRWLLATIITLTALSSASADEVLPSRVLTLPVFVLQGTTLVNFDIYDVRQETMHPARVVAETEPHSLFTRKQHIGIAMGDDNGIIHSSLGFYWTVAEWKRLNFGMPALEIGWGRYPDYDPSRQQSFWKRKPTLLVSLASIHYRVGYIRAFGANCYLNFEQVRDLRERFVGSQFGVSFSKQ
jgi:hypothetical protein